MAKILIVDDDEMFYDPFSFYIEELGHNCEIAENFHDGLNMVHKNDYDIVFLDVILPDISGLEGIGRLKKAPSSPEVIIITGQGDSYGAEKALKNGAWDYLEKPPSYTNIKLLVGRALEYREKKLQFCEQKVLNREFIIGNDPKLRDCLEVIARAAGNDGSVFITGETGTGKELMAKAVHINSPRAKRNFVTVDCTNIPVNLAESLLFGHTKGSFTGAHSDQEGLIRQAEGGTLFLDEVGDLHPSVQKSLLSILQNKKFRPLGAKKEVICNFRVISATNRDLKKMVKAGHFRKDLYFRLVAFHVHVPSLRNRADDIKLLMNHYIYIICDEFGISTKGVSKDFTDSLMRYEWSGNIRELTNVLHATIANAMNEPTLYPHHLPVDMRIHFCKAGIKKKEKHEENNAPAVTVEINRTKFPELREFRKLAESEYLDDLIKLSESNVSRACRLSGASRSGLYQLLEKHGKRMKRGTKRD
ncbi:sigma-54 dependent transcriptional regulator [Desulfococcaceae bacterium HSG8]|nr:sigma-54 dependent transcriptional regulator [Desulfococcaceae bacterium HSG8]